MPFKPKTDPNDVLQQNINHEICLTQQEIFEWAIKQGYNIEAFAEWYLRSDFCNKQFDREYSWYHLQEAEAAADDFQVELDQANLPKESASNSPEDGWEGYFYKLLQIETTLPSHVLIEKIPYQELQKLWYDYENEFTYEEAVEDAVERFHLEAQKEESVPELE